MNGATWIWEPIKSFSPTSCVDQEKRAMYTMYMTLCKIASLKQYDSFYIMQASCFDNASNSKFLYCASSEDPLHAMINLV